MFFILRNFYILLSLSIRFNCLWNFVSLWLWVALDLFFFCFCFHGILLVCGYGLSGFKFFLFLFLFFFSLQISTFSSSSFVVKSMAKKNHEIFVIRFSFSPFFLVMQFLLDFWFPRILLFDFNSVFVLVWYIVLLSSSFTLVFPFYKLL